MFKWVLLSIMIFACVFLVLIGLWVYSIYYAVKHSPRADMFMCPRHGPLLRSHCIMFMNEPFCPRCWADKMDWAKRETTEQFRYKN